MKCQASCEDQMQTNKECRSPEAKFAELPIREERMGFALCVTCRGWLPTC
jgi:hypothetical protein